MSLASFRSDGYFERTLTGFDPEIFVVNGENALIPAFDFLQSKQFPTYYNPTQPDETTIPFRPSYYWDGFQAEFSTYPYRCHGWAMDQLQLGLKFIRSAARRHDQTAKLTIKNVFEFAPGDLFKYPPECIELGCDPSMNAYNRPPFEANNPFEVPVRMAGGHIHYARPKLEIEEARDIAKYLDWILAIPAVGMFERFDNPVRREYYGRAGEFRFPSYGIEYRTLSNAWLGHPAIANVFADMGRWTLFHKGLRQHVSPKDFGFTFGDIQTIVDSTDVAGARELFQKSGALWETLICHQYGQNPSRFFRPFEKMVMSGVDSLIPAFGDVEGNWDLNNPFHHSGGRDRTDTSWSSFVYAHKD